MKGNMYSVKIPATSANMGVGFDSTGLAVELYNTIHFFEIEEPLIIETDKESPNVPRDKRNLIYRAAKYTAEKYGKRLPGLYMKQFDDIPSTRGLGSSAACIVGGICIADTLLGLGLDRMEMLNIATDLEGHPDNVAPAIFGGVCISAVDDGRVVSHPIPIRDDLAVAVLIPSFTLSTKKARSVLPEQVSMADAINNISREGLLISALYSGNYELLSTALQDRLHQPYRKRLIAGYDKVTGICGECGAYASCISGAGPTILSFFPAAKEDTEALLNSRLADIAGGWRAIVAPFDRQGFTVKIL